ncbi:MAG: aminotransferase class I/II-fold pyridoxal phosphate-dependent enzyme [Fibrobacteres bacterium]|nr:aminotransferase class I/II-fold pyridoxal phosphate-dependent enzyme [Fibrobacterota bacterium]
MNQLAVELNTVLQKESPAVYEMLSDFGKRIYFPKGILHQGAEAKAKAKKYNATVGIAVENGEAMHLKCIKKHLPALKADEIFPYAPPQGLPKLRELWKKKLLEENPSMRDKTSSMPIVTAAIAHGLSTVGELFVGKGDALIVPDQYWDNYPLTFCVRNEAELFTYDTFTPAGGFNVAAFEAAVMKHGMPKKKAVVILNFPNNPTGYSVSKADGEALAAAIKRCAEAGINMVVIHDDAYFGLVYEDVALAESLFGLTANIHERVLAIKLCGATKEEFVWGFRTGFITYGVKSANAEAVFGALEKKTMGSIRVSISNSPLPSQTLVLKALEDADFKNERKEKFEIMKARALKVKKVLQNPLYNEFWDVYPFNAGYFMCVKLKKSSAEALRVHLLDKYGVGTIATGEKDLRVAFSSVEESQIEDLFTCIYNGAKDLA